MGEQQYSRQFITEVEKHINPILVDFFNQNHGKFPVHNMKDAIYDTLMSFFGGQLNRDELLVAVNKAKKSRLQKRSRWSAGYKYDLKNINRENPAYPIDLSGLDEHEAAKRIEKELHDTARWKDRKNSFFIEFPALHQQFTATSIWNSFKTDLILSIWEYIDKELNGNISSFYRSYPESLIESPLFSPSSFNLIMSETGNNLLEEKVCDELGNQILTINIPNNKFTPPRVMDTTDLKILNTFISYINNNFYSDKTVVVDIGTLAKSVVDYHAGTAVYAAIAERCSKLVEYNYTIQSDNGKISFNLFDNIIVRNTGTKAEHADALPDYSVVATFGEVLANAIIQKRLVKVTEKNYGSLKHPMSKIIYYALQKDRVSLNGSGNMTCKYSYTYFQKIVRFRVRNRSKNLKAIEESLNDFVESGVCVESFQRMNDGCFLIRFLPLSEEELADIDFNSRLPEKK